MENDNIGKRVANLRKQNGWSQMELAQKLNVTDKAVSKWENGGMPSIDLLPELSKIFNVSIDYLMLGDNEADIEEAQPAFDEAIEDETVCDNEFTLEGLNADDIKLILRDQTELYSEDELKILRMRLEALTGSSEIYDEEEEKIEEPSIWVCPQCGVVVEDTSQTACEYCMCDFTKKSLIKRSADAEWGDGEEYEPHNGRVESGSIGCVGYLVALLFPIIGLIWGIIRGDKGVVIFSIIMTILDIISSIAIYNALLSYYPYLM